MSKDGHRVGELVPQRRFVPRDRFATMSRDAPAVDLDAFRGDQEAVLDQGPAQRYQR